MMHVYIFSRAIIEHACHVDYYYCLTLENNSLSLSHMDIRHYRMLLIFVFDEKIFKLTTLGLNLRAFLVCHIS